MKVPFLDLKVQYESIKAEIHESMQNVMEKTAFAGGEFVDRFEREFADYCGVPYAVGLANGTDALWLALWSLGIGRGDEVITVPNTFIATVEAISIAGATPVFVDIDEKTYNMNPEKLENAITKNTRAIIPVHLYGQMADMGPILEIARRYDLYVIEDASQAHGAEYKGKRAGSMGDIGCFSFYPGKNLGAYGEAGAMVTSSEEIATRARMLRDHGQSQKYYHSIVGTNARMDGLQGAILSVKLKYLEAWTRQRREHAARYTDKLKGVRGVVTPFEYPDGRHVYHIYSLMVDHPENVQERLKEQGVFCARHYPVPIHLQKAYSFMNLREGCFPVAERCSRNQLSLPMFAELQDEQVDFVCDTIIRHMGDRK
jgi:dTDP-4-amino-4,6-dideoxygalactose transaminase